MSGGSGRPTLSKNTTGEPPYGGILVIVLALYVFASAADGAWALPVLLSLATVALGLSALRERIPEQWWIVLITVAVALLVLSALAANWPSGWRTGLVDIAIAIALAVSGVLLLRRLAARRVVTTTTVFGAIDVYLLIGLAFSVLYHGIQSLTGDPYFVDAIEGTRNTMLYFSFVSLSTLGYGDLTPASDTGRSLAVVEVLIGQIMLVTVIARLVSLVRTPNQTEPSVPDQ